MENLDEAKERLELDRWIVIGIIMCNIREFKHGYDTEIKRYVEKMDDDTFLFLMRMFKMTDSLLAAINIVKRQDPTYDDVMRDIEERLENSMKSLEYISESVRAHKEIERQKLLNYTKQKDATFKRALEQTPHGNVTFEVNGDVIILTKIDASRGRVLDVAHDEMFDKGMRKICRMLTKKLMKLVEKIENKKNEIKN